MSDRNDKPDWGATMGLILHTKCFWRMIIILSQASANSYKETLYEMTSDFKGKSSSSGWRRIVSLQITPFYNYTVTLIIKVSVVVRMKICLG